MMISMGRFGLALLLLSAGAEASPARDALASLLLPGSSQLMRGKKIKGALFISAEVCCFVSVLGLRVYGKSLELDSRSFAWSKAGANANSGDDEYWSAVELHRSYEEYMEDLRLEARRLYPDDRQAQEEYVESHRVEGRWEWKSDEDWQEFQSLRKNSRVAYTRAALLLGAVAANHLASALDAFLTARGLKKGVLEGSSFAFSISPHGTWSFTLSRQF